MRRVTVSKKSPAVKFVQELDAFPKVPESYQETSVSGGGMSIAVFALILLLIVSEFTYYIDTELKFHYEVDTSIDGKLKINIDMTVAMPCQHIGADVLDLTGQGANMFGELKTSPVHFNLSPRQRDYQRMMQQVNSYIKNEYHAIHDFLWTTGYHGLDTNMPDREDKPEGAPDGCRIHGSLQLNKVAGNFHITAGKSVPVIPGGHAHLSLMLDERDYNFSHRISQFSFGDQVSGIVNPLDGDEQITRSHYHIYQYFIQVVPTNVKTKMNNLDTYQYAVTERNRTINHAQGSHGVPGIFVKYDLSSLKVFVQEEHQPFWQFLIRLCGIVGGIFATSGMIHGFFTFLGDIICCKYHLGKYRQIEPVQPKPLPEPINSEYTNSSIPSVNLVPPDGSVVI